MKYELYIDVFFLLNLFMDVLLLFLMKLVLKCTATHFRLVMGAVFGAGAASILTILPGIPAGLKLFAGYGIISIGMIRLSFRQLKLTQACTAAVYLYGFAFLLGGALHFLSAQFSFFRADGIGVLGICAAAVFTYGVFSFCYQKRKRKKESSLVSVRLVWKDRESQLTALVDTGNSLYEPISGRAVSILEKEAARLLFAEKKPELFRAIPFHSIGRAHGILEGCELTELVITDGYEEIRVEKPMVGLFEGQVSADGAYQMILHPTLTKKQEESV